MLYQLPCIVCHVLVLGVGMTDFSYPNISFSHQYKSFSNSSIVWIQSNSHIFMGRISVHDVFLWRLVTSNSIIGLAKTINKTEEDPEFVLLTWSSGKVGAILYRHRTPLEAMELFPRCLLKHITESFNLNGWFSKHAIKKSGYKDHSRSSRLRIRTLNSSYFNCSAEQLTHSELQSSQL